MNKKRISGPCLIAFCFVVILVGCTNTQHQVLAATGTVIGIDISQDPATGAPHAKIGYDRAELAVVPTNRSLCTKEKNSAEPKCTELQGAGAKDTTDVLMELRFKSAFTFSGDAGIYQRLAVGANAVGQPGAAFMFAKDASGELKPDTANAVATAITPKALSGEQLGAVEKIAKSIANSGIVDDSKLKEFFICAGFTGQEPQRLAKRYKGKSTDKFKATLLKDYSWDAPGWVEKCIK
jgi:hypothetical protein